MDFAPLPRVRNKNHPCYGPLLSSLCIRRLSFTLVLCSQLVSFRSPFLPIVSSCSVFLSDLSASLRLTCRVLLGISLVFGQLLQVLVAFTCIIPPRPLALHEHTQLFFLRSTHPASLLLRLLPPTPALFTMSKDGQSSAAGIFALAEVHAPCCSLPSSSCLPLSTCLLPVSSLTLSVRVQSNLVTSMISFASRTMSE